MFEAGQRVRCVSAEWFASDGQPLSDAPVLNGVYTVAGTLFDRPCCHIDPYLMLVLAEKPPVDGELRAYQADGFRPLEDAEFERLREACLKPPLRVSEPVGRLA